MIISSLYDYYNRLAADPTVDIPLFGYSVARVSFALNISRDGELLNVIDLRMKHKNKLIAVDVTVPEQVIRSSGVAPNFLCDNCMYILGFDAKGKAQRTRQAFNECKKLHEEILKSCDDPGAKAVISFFSKWKPELAPEHSALKMYFEDIIAGANLVFMLDGEYGYIHNRPSVRDAWEAYKATVESDVMAQCLVTGKKMAIARIHPGIKGVPGAQPSGAALVSFNQDAFESYGKKQNYNSPISEQAAFGYTTALRYILNNPRQRLNLGDETVMVFWSDASEQEENLLAELLNPTDIDKKDDTSDTAHDWQTIATVHDTLLKVRDGKPINLEHLDTRARFYILGLSSNAARLAVRFWQVDSFGNLVQRIAQHYADMAIERPASSKSPEFIYPTRVLYELKPPESKEKTPPLFGGLLMRSILTGRPYPEAIYTAMISRIRADQNVDYVRAAIIRGCLVRKQRSFSAHNFSGGTIGMSLDENNTNQAYRLGRLFAVLEHAQTEALGKDINATIRDKYFGSASATPAAVFPMLLRLAQHHIAKAEYGYVDDKRIQEILNGMDAFPAYLNLEQQGMFMLGYYHQRQAFYKKGEE